jgi:hypothetical protein
MFFGLFSSHLPFIILGAVYFVTFAFASVQRMANAGDEQTADDGSTQYFQIADTQSLPQVLHLPDSQYFSDEIQANKTPYVISFWITKPEREKLLQPYSNPHTGIIPTRPPPFRS